MLIYKLIINQRSGCLFDLVIFSSETIAILHILPFDLDTEVPGQKELAIYDFLYFYNGKGSSCIRNKEDIESTLFENCPPFR